METAYDTESTASPDSARLSKADRDALDLVRNLKCEAKSVREGKAANRLSLEDEWKESANRFMGNVSGGSEGDPIYAVGRQEQYRVFSPGGYSGIRGLHVARIMRTQTSTIANTAATGQQPIRGRLQPAETGDTPMWFLTKRGARRLKRIIDQYAQQAAAQTEAEMAEELQAADQAAVETADETGVMDPASAADYESERADVERAGYEAIERSGSEVHAMFGNIRPEQLDGAHGPAQPLDEDQHHQLMMLLESGEVPELQQWLDPEEDFISVNDQFVARCAQEVLDNRWELADADLHWLLNEFYCNIYGQQDIRFEWEPKKHCFKLCNVHPMNVWTDHQALNVSDRAFHIEDYVVSADKAAAMWPKHANMLRKAATEGSREDDEFGIAAAHDRVDYKRKMLTVTVAYVRSQKVPMTEDEAVDAGKVVDASGVYTLVGGGGAVKPSMLSKDAGDWPLTDDGLRQIVCVMDAKLVVYDGRCPYMDIPHGWNLNFPRSDFVQAYGVGEPVRLRDVDDQIRRTLSLLANYLAYYPFPQYYWPAQLMRELKRMGYELHSMPGANIPIPDNDYWEIVRNGGFNAIRQDTPQVPGIFMQYLQFLLQEHDASSGNVGVRQGRSPTNDASGKMVRELAAQAAGPLAFKARFLEFAVERVTKLALDAMCKWMPEKVWSEILNRYEIPVIREVIKRAKRNKWNVVVRIAVGRGAQKSEEQDKALGLHQRGLLPGEEVLREYEYERPKELLERRTEEDLRRSGLTALQNEQQALAAAAGEQEARQDQPTVQGQEAA